MTRRNRSRNRNVRPNSSNHPTVLQMIQRVCIVMYASAIAAAAITGVYKLIGIKELTDKIILVLLSIGIVLYVGYDIKDKIKKWRL